MEDVGEQAGVTDMHIHVGDAAHVMKAAVTWVK